MFYKLFLAFTLIPVIELYLLIKIGTHIGAGPTLLLVFGTGLLGAYLARLEGLRALFRIQEEMRSNRVPAAAMLDGFIIFIAGVLLITPGLLTDIAGFLLLIPVTRQWFKQWLAYRFRDMIERGNVRLQSYRYPEDGDSRE